MADDVCPALSFANARVQGLCSRASTNGAVDAEAVTEAEDAHVIVKAMRAADGSLVTKAECGQSAIRRHKIVSACPSEHTSCSASPMQFASTPGYCIMPCLCSYCSSGLPTAARTVGYTAEDRARSIRIEEKLDEHAARSIRIEAKLDNVKVRIANSSSRAASHRLLKLKREEQGDGVGEEPPPEVPFPETRGDVQRLNPAALSSLQQFYGVTFSGPSITARQNEFEVYIAQ